MLAAAVFAGLVEASLAVSLVSPVQVDLGSLASNIASGCSNTGAISCHNTTTQSDLCCFESPGGLLLQTQFWDTNPSSGPSNSWTIHGLWPDNCDGTFQENCDPSRAYKDIAGLLTSQGAGSTLDFMNTFWVDINGQNEHFWEHEWSTHGTCYSTLGPQCLPSGSPTGAEAVAFFETVVSLFQTLPTYTWLANHGITPSSTQTQTLAALTSALKTESGGFTPALSCTGRALNSISWYFNIQGSLMDGKFIPINAPKAGTCPSSGIKYLPKTGSPVSTTTSKTTKTTTTSSSSTTTTTSSTSPPTGTSLPSKATIKAQLSGSTVGGLLSRGTWSTQTLSTYTLTGTTSSFTLKTSKGACGVTSGEFSCGSGISATPFSALNSGGQLLLASDGSTTFSSDSVPSGSDQETVFVGGDHANTYTLAIVGS